MTTVESNKLIAKFMGYETNKHNQCYRESLGEIGWEYMLFEASWDWLMPVVAKISGIEGAYAAQTLFVVKANILNIEQAHKAVVNFIQWYNKK